MRRGVAALTFSAALLVASAARAERVADWPCSGCRALLPDGLDPVPLLVLLHGDYGQSTEALLRAWDKPTSSRRIAVLALACPRDRGCKGSYWQWDGEAEWLDEQVRALEARRPIDRARTWLYGWSGGASYIGLRTQAFEARFAAIVHHGGGIPPRIRECGANHPPIYFLVGDGNPLHHLAVRLRDHYEACDNPIVWKVLPHAEHTAEWTALAANAGTILDWLATKRRDLPALEAKIDAPSSVPSESESVSPLPAPLSNAPPSLPLRPPAEAPRSSCLCDLGRPAPHDGAAWSAFGGAIVFASVRRSRSRRPPR